MFFLQSWGLGGGKWYLFVQLTWGLLGLCKHSYNSIKRCYQVYSSTLCSKPVMRSQGVLVPHSFNSTVLVCPWLRLKPGDSDLHRHEQDWYLIPMQWSQTQYGLHQHPLQCFCFRRLLQSFQTVNKPNFSAWAKKQSTVLASQPLLAGWVQPDVELRSSSPLLSSGSPEPPGDVFR